MSSAGLAATHDEHESFIKTPQQLIVVLLLSFLVPIIGIIMLVYVVLEETGVDPATFEPKAVAARIQPVGRVEVVDPNAPKVVRAAEEIVKTVCAACHLTGAANAPKLGDKAAWAPHIKEGLPGMLKTAITGKGAMPPRGGVPDLSDYELARAIVHMANQSGGNMKEPAPPKEAAAPAAAAAAAAAKAGPAPTGSPATSSGTPAASPVGAPAKAAPAAAKK